MNCYINFDQRKTLLNLEGVKLDKYKINSSIEGSISHLSLKPLYLLEANELLFLIENNYCLEYMIPLAFEYLDYNLLERINYYSGDLLDKILNCEKDFWMRHNEYKIEIISLLEDKIKELKSNLDSLLKKLSFVFRTNNEDILNNLNNVDITNIIINFDINMNLEQLEKFDWGEPIFVTSWGEINQGTPLIKKCHDLRKKKLTDFTVEDLRLLIGQNIGLEYLLPLAFKILSQNIFSEGNCYPGDLLNSVLNIETGFWVNDLESRNMFLKIIINAINELKVKKERFEKSLGCI